MMGDESETENTAPRFYGKYRGKVTDNSDPMKLGRVMVEVPAVMVDQVVWAMPCTPYAGKKVGFFALPPKDANVWVEFEGGNPDYPIWSGCFWGKGELPALAKDESTKFITTDAIDLLLDDKKGLTIEVKSPVCSPAFHIIINKEGIEIKTAAALVKMDKTKFVVNNGALEVM